MHCTPCGKNVPTQILAEGATPFYVETREPRGIGGVYTGGTYVVTGGGAQWVSGMVVAGSES